MGVEKSSHWGCVIAQFGIRGLAAAIVYYLTLILWAVWASENLRQSPPGRELPTGRSG